MFYISVAILSVVVKKIYSASTNSAVGNQPSHFVVRARRSHADPSALRPEMRKPKRPCSSMRLRVRREAFGLALIFIIYLIYSRFRAKLKCGTFCRAAAAARQLLLSRCVSSVASELFGLGLFRLYFTQSLWPKSFSSSLSRFFSFSEISEIG